MSEIKRCKCQVCGNAFAMVSERRYTVREDKVTGLTNIAEHKEEKMYDAFDCPECGCQNLVNERLRKEEFKNVQANKG